MPTIDEIMAIPALQCLFKTERDYLRAAIESAIREARAAERERCAQIAATPVSGEQDDITMAAKDRIAAAIRALKD